MATDSPPPLSISIPPITILTRGETVSPNMPSHHPPEPTLIEDVPDNPLTHKRTFETLSRWVSRRIVTSPPPTRTTAPTASPRHHQPGARALKSAEAGFYLRDEAEYNDSGYSTPYTDTDADEEELIDSYAAFCRAFSAGHPEYQHHHQPYHGHDYDRDHETELPTQEEDEEARAEEGGYHYPPDYHSPRDYPERRQQTHKEEEEFPDITYEYHHTHDYHTSRERFYSRFHPRRHSFHSDDENPYSYNYSYNDEHDTDKEPKATSSHTLSHPYSPSHTHSHSHPPPEEYESGYESQSHPHRPQLSPLTIPCRSHSHSQYLSPPISPPARILTPTIYAQTQRAAVQERHATFASSQIRDGPHDDHTEKHTAQERTVQSGRRWSGVRAWWGKVGCWRPR